MTDLTNSHANTKGAGEGRGVLIPFLVRIFEKFAGHVCKGEASNLSSYEQGFREILIVMIIIGITTKCLGLGLHT